MEKPVALSHNDPLFCPKGGAYIHIISISYGRKRWNDFLKSYQKEKLTLSISRLYVIMKKTGTLGSLTKENDYGQTLV